MTTPLVAAVLNEFGRKPDPSAPGLVFEVDGTLPPETLATLPAELRERLTAPEFIEMARGRIAEQMSADRGVHRTGRRESRIEPIRVLRFSAAAGPNRKERRRLAAALRHG
jgi:hypothetical protein